MSIHELRICGKCLPVMFPGALYIWLVVRRNTLSGMGIYETGAERICQIEMGLGVIGMDFQGATVMLNGFLKSPHPPQRNAQIDLRQQVGWVGSQGDFIMADGLLQLALFHQREAQCGLSHEVILRHRNRVLEQRDAVPPMPQLEPSADCASPQRKHCSDCAPGLPEPRATRQQRNGPAYGHKETNRRITCSGRPSTAPQPVPNQLRESTPQIPEPAY